MGHVFSRQVRLTLVALLPMLILWLAFAGGANAAIPNNGTINQTTNPSTAWQGNFYTFGATNGDPQLCPPTSANDPLCDHFELTAQDAGPVRVVATWPSTAPTSPCAVAGACSDPTQNDFDILVCLNDPLADLSEATPDNCVGGTEIAFFSTNRQAFEGGTFQAAANTTYEIRVIPVFIALPGSDYEGCAEYTDASGTATRCAPTPIVTPPPVSTSEFFTCPVEVNGPLQRQVDGGGTIPSTVPGKKAPFSINVRRAFDGKGRMHFKGKVNYRDDGNLSFRSASAECATFTDGTNTSDSDKSTTFRGSVEVRGFGWVKTDAAYGNGDGHDHSKDDGQRVCYRAIGQDWGQPGQGKDRFQIELYAFDASTSTCSGTPLHVNSNALTDGNVKYKFRAEGKEEDDDVYDDGHHHRR